MKMRSLAELLELAQLADGPTLPPDDMPAQGGVDPLGLRQINFDLMDGVLPGLNNVARHIRPYTVVTWASRRALQLAEEIGDPEIKVDLIRDFVDRIEVIFLWSMILHRPSIDIPGAQYLAPFIRKERYRFGGDEWLKRRKDRRYSTALTAPINYGPGLKALGWVVAHPNHPTILMPLKEADAALDAFEEEISDRLNHAAFSHLGDAEVARDEVAGWAEAWDTATPTEQERSFLARSLLEEGAPRSRRQGGALMLEAARFTGDNRVNMVRDVMTGSIAEFRAAPELQSTVAAWRKVQIRQLFRFALEALFYWITRQLVDGSLETMELVDRFVDDLDLPPPANTAAWLHPPVTDQSPISLIDALSAGLNSFGTGELPQAIFDGIVLALAEAPEQAEAFERADRLPLARAKLEADAWGNAIPRDFLRHVIEGWVFAQHVYWSVGRGLADARSGGKTILRLRVVLEEGGWSLSRSASAGAAPVVTRDRLETALTLAIEAGLLGA
jgi:hypothetical protein